MVILIFRSLILVNTSSTGILLQLTTIDSCGLQVYDSQISKSILLTGTSHSDYTNTLIWDDFWNGRLVDYYNIYRSVNGLNDPVADCYCNQWKPTIVY